MMLVYRFVAAIRAESRLPVEFRAALVESLFAPLGSLVVGAVACGAVAVTVALLAGDPWLMVVAAMLIGVGVSRIMSAATYRRLRRQGQGETPHDWQRLYEAGAWAFSGLLGLLSILTIMRAGDPALHMIVAATSVGYSAGIAGRNAGRPPLAVGQLALAVLPLAAGLFLHGGAVYIALGIVLLLFIYGMIDILMGIRDVILQALTMTRNEAALAAQYEEQATRFDVALNNMSHGLCMVDAEGRVQVWNVRFLEMLGLERSNVVVGTSLRDLARMAIRRRALSARTVRDAVQVLHGRRRTWRDNGASRPTTPNQVVLSLDFGRTVTVSRRRMENGGAVVILEDITERRAAEEEISRLARFDELTGLPNRSSFRRRFSEFLTGVNQEENLAVHLLDLDRFKAVNDTLGHPVGDRLLVEVAQRLQSLTSNAQCRARLGGDEFVVLQSLSDDLAAARLARSICDGLSRPYDIDGHRIDIAASLGIALASKDGLDPDGLLKKADMALYAAKADGGDGYCFFAPEMEAEAQTRRSIEIDLRDALAESALDLYFQPLVALDTGAVTTCEALLRWSHPERGNISPDRFVSVAEEAGLAVPLGRWVLEHACKAAASWPTHAKVAVNLSPLDFRDGSLPARVVAALDASGLPPQRLELEVTERLLLEEKDSTFAIMEQLRALGVGLSLDDFGTGYSSLNYLRAYPFQKIKIDRSFVRDLGKGRGNSPIIRAVASLGKSLDMTVVAEGIETDEQLQLVRAQGCHEGQGNFLAQAMPNLMIRELLGTSANERSCIA